MNAERRVSRLEGEFSETVEKGHGSAYATVESFCSWWLQPIRVAQFDEKLEACYPQWVQRFGERQVSAAIDELVAEGKRVIEDDTMAMVTKDPIGRTGVYVHHLGGVDIEAEV